MRLDTVDLRGCHWRNPAALLVSPVPSLSGRLASLLNYQVTSTNYKRQVRQLTRTLQNSDLEFVSLLDVRQENAKFLLVPVCSPPPSRTALHHRAALLGSELLSNHVWNNVMHILKDQAFKCRDRFAPYLLGITHKYPHCSVFTVVSGLVSSRVLLLSCNAIPRHGTTSAFFHCLVLKRQLSLTEYHTLILAGVPAMCIFHIALYSHVRETIYN